MVNIENLPNKDWFKMINNNINELLLVRIKDKVTNQYYLPSFIPNKEIKRYILKFVYEGIAQNKAFDASEYEYSIIGVWDKEEGKIIEETIITTTNVKESFDEILAEKERQGNNL